MITIKIDEEDALDALVERVRHWTDDEDVVALYRKMYENLVYDGCFNGSKFDVMQIVDNDCINWCSVIHKGDDDFEAIKTIYDKNGLCDCSCDDVGFDFIEAVDDENNPTMFLMRN